MPASRPDQPEFIGGPEDGRIMDRQLCKELQTDTLEGKDPRIPILLRGNHADLADFEEGDEVEVRLLGFYIEEEGSNPPKFRWIEL